MSTEPKYSQNKVVQVLTPRTYELIGKIVTKASYLEFAIFFMATVANNQIELQYEEILTSREKILKLARKALDELAADLELPNFLSRDLFFEKVRAALFDRDGVAHGIIQRVNDEGLKAYHPKGKRNLDIDEESLEKIYQELDRLEIDAYLMRVTIWNRAKESGLIQLGALDIDHLSPQPGTRLA